MKGLLQLKIVIVMIVITRYGYWQNYELYFLAMFIYYLNFPFFSVTSAFNAMTVGQKDALRIPNFIMTNIR